MEKVSMNKLEMARRAAKGGSGGTIPPATSETLGGVKIGEGVNVSEDGTISVPTYAPPAYSTIEHLTGRKWLDGKDIYERTIALNLTYISDTSFIVNVDYSTIDTLLDSILEYKTPTTFGKLITSAWINSTAKTFNIKTNTTADSVTESYLTIHYTKAGA